MEWIQSSMNDSANREPVYNDSISRYNEKVLNQETEDKNYVIDYRY